MFWSFKVCTWTKTDNDYNDGYSDNLPIRPRTDVCLGDDSEIYKEWEAQTDNDED